MQIWDFFNAFFALCQPLSVLDLCQFCRISALDLWSLATEGTQEFPPLNFHLRALSIMNYEL